MALRTEAAETYAAAMTDPIRTYLEGRGITAHAVSTAGLGVVTEPLTGHERWRGWICIPYLTRAGVAALKFRRPPTMADGQRYDQPAGQVTGLYNVNDFHKPSPFICVTEGELDAVVASHVVGLPTVGVPGVSAWKSHYPRCFDGYGRVYVLADADNREDGRDPGLELSQRICETVVQAVHVSLPRGLDVSDLVAQRGANALLALIPDEGVSRLLEEPECVPF
jgi:DNA primase